MTAPLDLAALRKLVEARHRWLLAIDAIEDCSDTRSFSSAIRDMTEIDRKLATHAPALLDFAAEAARLIANSECGVGPTGRSLLARLAGNGEAR